MSKYADDLMRLRDERFPRNPCKLLKLWINGDEKKYHEVIEAISLRDENGNFYELAHVAKMLSEDLNIPVGINDIWKHRKKQCGGCMHMARLVNDD